MATKRAPTPTEWRKMRLLAPNLITATSLVFGLCSLVAAHEGRYVDSAWLIIYSVLADRLDGFVARRVRGESELGVQLDSLADFLNFGVAPAFLFFASLGSARTLPFQSGTGRVVLMAACATWVCGAIFRLARYNISTGEEEEQGKRIFFGVPTTLAAGTLIVWFLLLVKYAGPDHPLYAGPFGGSRWFGDWESPAWLFRYAPVILFLGGFLMASNLRIPGVSKGPSRPVTVFVAINLALGYICGFARVFPEYMVWPPTLWLILFLVWGTLSPNARSMRPPPVFPRAS
jgi:CDP-diacylglycerol--serine O-phosphatidyltransferase